MQGCKQMIDVIIIKAGIITIFDNGIGRISVQTDNYLTNHTVMVTSSTQLSTEIKA